VSRTFVVEIDSPLSREEVRHMILTKLSLPLGNAEYRIEAVNETIIAYARSYRPYWFPAILFFWLGIPLLLLLIVQTDRVILTLFDDPKGTRIVVVGDGPAAMRKQFEELGEAGL
jgi:hypothetical protein